MTDLIEGTLEKARAAIATHDLAVPDAAVLLMVSGGSDSTALAYLGAALREAGDVGPVAMLHVNHQLRGEDADADERFVAALAEALDIPLFICSIDIAAEAERSRENVEAVARRERYLAANEALRSMCQHEGRPLSEARIFTAHTADDRIENFYMRSIVGTGPGGFRSMLYRNGPVVRPLLDITRDELHDYLSAREAAGETVVRDESGALWREDATNAHTDRFRAYVRHKIVPVAKEWNSALPEVLTRSMNLIADEDDMLQNMAEKLADHMELVENAKRACEQAGMKPFIEAVRGGTDGCRLSYMGLPTPNLCTGGFAFHGPYEHIAAESMDRCAKMVELLMLGE